MKRELCKDCGSPGFCYITGGDGAHALCRFCADLRDSGEKGTRAMWGSLFDDLMLRRKQHLTHEALALIEITGVQHTRDLREKVNEENERSFEPVPNSQKSFLQLRLPNGARISVEVPQKDYEAEIKPFLLKAYKKALKS